MESQRVDLEEFDSDLEHNFPMGCDHCVHDLHSNLQTEKNWKLLAKKYWIDFYMCFVVPHFIKIMGFLDVIGALRSSIVLNMTFSVYSVSLFYRCRPYNLFKYAW